MVHGMLERAGAFLWIIVFCSKVSRKFPIIDEIEKEVPCEVFRLDIYRLVNFLPKTAHEFVGQNSLLTLVKG